MYLIVGIGKTGLSCVKHLVLRKKINESEIICIDSRDNPPCLEAVSKLFPKIKLQTSFVVGEHHVCPNVPCGRPSLCITSPGISIKDPIITNFGIKPIGDIELFAQYTSKPIIAITGSNGKSTVTTLIGEMAKEAGIKVAVGGNLGEPALDLIKNDEADLYILELSSFQLETTYSLKPLVSIVLNITEDHMDRYKSFEEYKSTKCKIYNDSKFKIINKDDPVYTGMLDMSYIKYGLEMPSDHEFGIVDNYICYGNDKILHTNKLKIKGMHNISNALAALALGKAASIDKKYMIKALKNFEGLKHRSQLVASINGVNWYNDSKGTNVGATKASIIGIGSMTNGKIILIAGGLGKNADFADLRDVIKKYVKLLILIGKDAPVIKKALFGCVEMLDASSMRDAVEQSFLYAKNDDAVLLSPACASYDMFDNFEHRGDVFIQIVKSFVK